MFIEIVNKPSPGKVWLTSEKGQNSSIRGHFSKA